MNIGEIIEVNEPPYYRKMIVESGYLYNFWSIERDDYLEQWIFVPESDICLNNNERIK